MVVNWDENDPITQIILNLLRQENEETQTNVLEYARTISPINYSSHIQDLLFDYGIKTNNQQILKNLVDRALEHGSRGDYGAQLIKRASENNFDFTIPIYNTIRLGARTAIDIAIRAAKLPEAGAGALSGTEEFTEEQADELIIITALKKAIDDQITRENEKLNSLRAQQNESRSQAEALQLQTEINRLEAKHAVLLAQQEKATNALATLEQMQSAHMARTSAKV